MMEEAKAWDALWRDAERFARQRANKKKADARDMDRILEIWQRWKGIKEVISHYGSLAASDQEFAILKLAHRQSEKARWDIRSVLTQKDIEEDHEQE